MGDSLYINTCELVSNPRLSLSLGGCQIPLAFLEFQGAQGRLVCGEPPQAWGPTSPPQDGPLVGLAGTQEQQEDSDS